MPLFGHGTSTSTLELESMTSFADASVSVNLRGVTVGNLNPKKFGDGDNQSRLKWFSSLSFLSLCHTLPTGNAEGTL